MYKITTLPFLLYGLISLFIFDIDYPLILCQLCKSNTLCKIFMILGRKVEQNKRHVMYKNDNSAFLTFGVPPFVIFDSYYPLILCPLCKSNTLCNIFMILGRNVEQDKTMCHVQNNNFAFLTLWPYLPFYI